MSEQLPHHRHDHVPVAFNPIDVQYHPWGHIPDHVLLGRLLGVADDDCAPCRRDMVSLTAYDVGTIVFLVELVACRPEVGQLPMLMTVDVPAARSRLFIRVAQACLDDERNPGSHRLIRECVRLRRRAREIVVDTAVSILIAHQPR
jgi:hypothetical protein